jgi:hypothetical protein
VPSGFEDFRRRPEVGNKVTKPTVLLATTSCWVPTARLGIALAKAGFQVKAICPLGHPLEKTGAAQEIFIYRGLAPIVTFTDAIAVAKPDLIIPGDDLATQHLHTVYFQGCVSRTSRNVCEIIERSLGSAESFRIVQSRARVMEAARQEGVRVPRTRVIAGLPELRDWNASVGLPVAMKADGSSGGDGVRIANSMDEAVSALRCLSNPPLWIRAAKRALVNRDTTLVWPTIVRRARTVNAQAFVAGQEATSTVACWNGRVLAALHCEVVRKSEPTGPATVLRLVDDPEMSAAAEKVVRRLKLSGIHGFDFMRDAEAGSAHLIEMNPRSTQVGHFALGAGRDLPAALYAAVSGDDLQPAPLMTEKDTIALFPSEWIRDSASPFLRSAYHDVPWEEPELIRACIRSRRRKISWYSPKEEFRAFRELVSATDDGTLGGPPFRG